jgi:hypothetical protein
MFWSDIHFGLSAPPIGSLHIPGTLCGALVALEMDMARPVKVLQRFRHLAKVIPRRAGR